MYIFGILDDELGSFSVSQICSMSDFELERNLFDPQSVKNACRDIDPFFLLQKSSIISLIISIGILILFKLVSLFCGTDRDRNANVFPKLIPVTILIIAGQVLVQGLILAYLSYLIPVEIIGYYLPVVTILICAGAAIGFFQVIVSLSSFFKKPQHPERAIIAEKETYPKLWNHIEKIATKIGAEKPDNIIIGLEPTFYAISAEVNLIGDKTIKGETLFLSLPLMKLFTVEELDGVIGHELGHFKSKDTRYSSKFSPVYANLGKSLENLANTTSLYSAIAKLPAIFVLTAMYDSFATNIASISREREFEADKVGCQASTKEGMVYSLAKVVTYSNLWEQTKIENIKRLNNGKISENLSEVFRESALYNIGKRDINETIKEVLPSIIQHPTDSHPPISERYQNLDFDIENLTRDKITHQGNASNDLIDNVKELEESLTFNEHQFYIALGYANIPDKTDDSGMATIIYSLAAAMIGADGKIDNDEIRVAEDLGVQLLEEFDRVDFREYVKNLDKIPDFKSVADACTNLNSDNKIIIFNFLKAIAEADEDFDKSEESLLNELKNIWSLNIDWKIVLSSTELSPIRVLTIYWLEVLVLPGPPSKKNC